MRRTSRPPGTQGYAEQAATLIARYGAIPFRERHRASLHLFPAVSSRILDIGAGTGVDAAWFAAQGHIVVAVEPTAEFRAAAMDRHPSTSIEWLDDALPELKLLLSRQQSFDLIMLSAVWMHLDASERCDGMARVTSLLAPGGAIVLSLRHGPVPAGRRMFQVSVDETIELAWQHGLRPTLNVQIESIQALNRAHGVTWTQLAFKHSINDAPAA